MSTFACLGDDAFDSAIVMEVHDENSVIAYSKTRSFWPVQARDLVVKIKVTSDAADELVAQKDPVTFGQFIDNLDSNGYKINVTSVENDLEYMKKQPGYSRAYLHYAVFDLKRVANEDSTNELVIDLRVKSDPKGSLPIKVMTMLGDMVPKNLQLIHKYLLKRGSPPAIVFNSFSGVRMENVDWHNSSNVFEINYTETAPGSCISIVRIALSWLKVLKCNAVNFDVFNGKPHVDLQWQYYRDNIYVKLTVSNRASVNVLPINLPDVSKQAIMLSGESKAECEFMHENIPRNSLLLYSSAAAVQALSASLSNQPPYPVHSKQQPFSLIRLVNHELNRRISGYLKIQNVLTAQREPNETLQSTRIAVQGHPLGIVHANKRFEVLAGYFVDEYIDILIAIVTSSYCRQRWDEMFAGGKAINFVSMAEKNLQTPFSMYNSYVKIVSSSTKSIWPVSPRQLLVMLLVVRRGQSRMILASDIPTELIDNIPTDSFSDDYVRATLDFANWTFKPGPDNSVDISYTIQTNPNGSIPNFIIERMANNFSLAIDNVVEFHDSHGCPPFFLDSPWSSTFENGSFVFHLDHSIIECESDVVYGNLIIDHRWTNGRSILIRADDDAKCRLVRQSRNVSEIEILNCGHFEIGLGSSDLKNSVFLNGTNISVCQEESSARIVSGNELEMLQRAMREYRESMDESRALETVSLNMDVDSNLLESLFCQASSISQILGFRRSSTASLASTNIPGLFTLSLLQNGLIKSRARKFGVFRRKLVGQNTAKSFILVFDVAVGSTECLSLMIDNQDSYLTKKSCVQILKKPQFLNIKNLAMHLQNAEGVYFKTITRFVVSPEAYFHERDVKTDDIIIERIGNLKCKCTLFATNGHGELVIPRASDLSCDVLIDSSDPRVVNICTVAREEAWLIDGERKKYWILGFHGMQGGMIIDVYIELEKVAGRATLSVNGVAQLPVTQHIDILANELKSHSTLIALLLAFIVLIIIKWFLN